MLTYRPGWNQEVARYADRFGSYQGFLSAFSSRDLERALFDGRGKFNDRWVREFIDVAMDPFNRERVVTIEQGAHQVESRNGGRGFCLHFTGRDHYGYALHFYLRQTITGQAELSEVTYKDRGRVVSVRRGN